jgi:citrate lyase subunit beta/citryl-CoA lyase
MEFDGIGTGLITSGLSLELMSKAARTAAEVIHIELEDGVPHTRKGEARALILQALRELDWSGKMTLIRVDPYMSGDLEEDIEAVVPGRPSAILLGKCEGPVDVTYADRVIARAERQAGIERGTVKLAAMIERSAALHSIDDVARASARMVALYLGPSDLGNEVGYRRTYHGLEPELSWVRSRVVVAAHAAGLLAIDAPYVPFRDLDGTYEHARWSYRLGFDAKTCLSPRQIEAVARAFTPDREEIVWASAVLEGAEQAWSEDRTVWVAQDMMMDAPHVIRAQRILKSAKRGASNELMSSEAR